MLRSCCGLRVVCPAFWLVGCVFLVCVAMCMLCLLNHALATRTCPFLLLCIYRFPMCAKKICEITHSRPRVVTVSTIWPTFLECVCLLLDCVRCLLCYICTICCLCVAFCVSGSWTAANTERLRRCDVAKRTRQRSTLTKTDRRQTRISGLSARIF